MAIRESSYRLTVVSKLYWQLGTGNWQSIPDVDQLRRLIG
jgi:hypothetical protein